MGTPVPTRVVCSDCGLPWGDHAVDRNYNDGSITTAPSECIRLLKAELAKRALESFPWYPNAVYPPAIMVETPNTLIPWTNYPNNICQGVS